MLIHMGGSPLHNGEQFTTLGALVILLRPGVPEINKLSILVKMGYQIIEVSMSLGSSFYSSVKNLIQLV